MPEYRTKRSGEIYIKFSDSEVEQAKNTNMTDMLSSEYGFSFIRYGSSYQCREHDSLVILGNCRSWFWNSRGLHGWNGEYYRFGGRF